jgi:transcriptional regulator with PAS, ATPase and Fis domain
VHPEASDPNATTQSGSLDSPPKSSPPVWKLRLLYVGGQGILKSDAVTWHDSRPLGIGRRSASPAQGSWLQVNDERISREHARLHKQAGGIFVEDLHSRNGSVLNGVRLSPADPQPIRDGDVLRLGDSFVLLRYEPHEIRDASVASIIGISQAACALRFAICRCALRERQALFVGESGTGKEVAAQALHLLSRRAGALITVNCAAIPATLAEAQFFGVARGAFTGAVEHGGLFGEADHGTLLLDEVGDLPLELQPKLLRALETGEVMPVGSQRPVPRDVRILSATNRDLGEALRSRTFREDLYARLSAEVIQLAPLRQRREDILLLAQRFEGPHFHPSPRLAEALLLYAWPRNIRELGHVASRLSDRSEDEVIQSLTSAPAPPPPPPVAVAKTASLRWQHGDPAPTREQVMTLLREHRGNLSHIEMACGYSRRQFRRWVDGYDLDPANFRVR